MKLANHTSLKEWATVIDALGRGDQVILIRKGGIADPRFGVEAERFYLYPTYFHTGRNEPPDSVTITHWCEVVRTWRVRELDRLYALTPLTVMDRETIETRYRFREDQAAHIIGVCAFRLPQPVTIRVADEYSGCRSWISIDDEIDVDGSTAVLSEDALNAKLDSVDALLAVSAGQQHEVAR